MAYKYNITNKWRELLPAHYVKRCMEFDNAPPLPIHWKPAPGKYKINPKTGERLRIIDDPIPPIYPEEANQGLWGGEGLVQGLIRKKKNKLRIPRLWLPCLTRRPLYSEVLDRWMIITVTFRTLDQIDDCYGFDNYILKTSEIELNSKLGMDLKREMILTLANKSLYPNNPEKREKIYEKYKQFIMPVEEAEWLGLSTREAIHKAKAIKEAENPVRPLKEIFAESFIEELEAGKDSDGSSSSGWLTKLNPFSKSSESTDEKPS
ncbi:large ribosomal subunit protein bL28m-like [Liolophura sinensis]|uniref:large ribosomal subunit protein bL28m-like n=1 Tax=Liolophura sinensis TaxID=3198878 RepID=UPI0031582861